MLTSSTINENRGLRVAGLLLLVALAAMAMAFASPPKAGAVASMCTEPDGTTWRAEWTRNSSGTTWATNLLKRAPGGSSYGSYSEGADGRWTKLEWMQPSTVSELFSGSYAPWSTTFYLNQEGYDNEYGHVLGRSNATGYQVPGLLSPRVAWLNDNSGQDRTSDECTVFLGDYNGSSGPKVAIAGDSITVQMTHRFSIMPSWRLFVEPQSGASFTTLRGEFRGLRAGLRDPATGAQAAPDVLVMAAGTNDGNWIGEAGADLNGRKAAWDDVIEGALDDTAGVCRVLVTPMVTGRKTQTVWGPPNQLAGRDYVRDRILQIANQQDDVVAVDWHAVAEDHFYGDPVPWYDPGDATHPNSTGLYNLSNMIKSAALNCS